MSTNAKPFIPAAGNDWLLPFYDLFTKLLGVEASHQRLLEQAAIQPGYRLLEIGCGTGNLAILAKRLNPSADVLGIDPDPKALSRARKKVRQAGVQLEFCEAFTEELPLADGSIDKVLSAFMLHHIPPNSRLAALSEVCRVLKPGGTLHLADFEHGENPQSHHSPHASHQASTSRAQSGIAQLMLNAGFQEAKRVGQQTSLLGEIAYHIAVR